MVYRIASVLLAASLLAAVQPLAAGEGPSEKSSAKSFPELPEGVTSFGAAIVDDALYIYGGHTGQAHSYSNTSQSNVLRRLNLEKPAKWEKLVKGPRLQGLAMVGHEGNLYRIGGFTAKNEEGEEHDLVSVADVAKFDPQAGKWETMPALPEPRSSFDACVLDDAIYVVGGWQLRGGSETKWHETAYRLDLSAKSPEWKAIATPPFQRRALALAAHDGKIYAIGGMQQEGGPSTRVDVFDPAANEWTKGPSLQGEPMEGFGASAFATGGKLYVTTIRGKLQRLAQDGESWETLRELETARFFHRMLPLNEGQLLSVGGANMSIGKFQHLDVIDVK